jgi:hypothetical protein
MNVERTILGADSKELTSGNKSKKGLTGLKISKASSFAQDVNIFTERGWVAGDCGLAHIPCAFNA